MNHCRTARADCPNVSAQGQGTCARLVVRTKRVNYLSSMGISLDNFESFGQASLPDQFDEYIWLDRTSRGLAFDA